MGSLKATIPAALAAGMLFGAGAQAGMTTTVFALSDHPDGNVSPPPYGLRFDNLFTTVGGTGGTTSFSMDMFGDTTLTVNDDGLGTISIDIVGTVYGGVDTGAGYGYGEGAFALDFSYTLNVTPDGTGWDVNPADPLNNGTLTALAGNADLTTGEVFTFEGVATDGGASFLFLQDGHRLGGHPEIDPNVWVGRGWVNTAAGLGGTHDFLFIGELIPAPGSVLLLVGGGAFGAIRRRR